MRCYLALSCSLLFFACDGDPPPEEDAGTDAAPPVDSGPFVCDNPAWNPSTDPPRSDTPRPTELSTIDRTVDGATRVAFDPGSVTEDGALFDLGVQAGAMTADGVRLWTRVSTPGPSTLRVWRESDTAGEVMLAIEQPADSLDGGYVHVPLTGLSPATRYSYAFFSGSAPAFTGRSAIGSFLTALPAGAIATIRVTASTCTNQSTRPFEALSRMSDEDPDVYLNLGDMTYNDGATTLEEYRAAWAGNIGDPGYRAILQSTGAYHTWDDHEVVDSSTYYDIPAAQRDTAYDAYFENLPVDAIDRGGERSIWTSYPWGDSVEFIVLDSRSERDPATRETPGATYISDAQLAFLEDRLMNSTARFKVVLNSVPIANLPIPPWALEDDRWQGYAAQRDALVSFIRTNRIENVWFLTGDFHLGYVARVEPDSGGPAIWEVAVGPGGSAGGNPVPLLVEAGMFSEQDAFPCDLFTYWSSVTSSTTTIDFDAGAGTAHVVFRDPESNRTLYDEIFFVE